MWSANFRLKIKFMKIFIEISYFSHIHTDNYSFSDLPRHFVLYLLNQLRYFFLALCRLCVGAYYELGHILKLFFYLSF